jgi:hypothetical protein
MAGFKEQARDAQLLQAKRAGEPRDSGSDNHYPFGVSHKRQNLSK